MTFDEFKQIPPSGSEILLFFENYSIGAGYNQYIVKAVNVDVTPCNTADGKNITELAETAAHMTLDINYSPAPGETQQAHTTYIQEREAQEGYYYFKIDPIYFTHDDTDIAQVSSCAIGTGRYFGLDGFVPDVIRENDDDNLLMNNVDGVEKSLYNAFKVIYKNNQTSPFNLQNILTGSAEESDVQLYNYNATGMKRGKYEGSKTNESDYAGIPSALSLTSFRAAAYQTRVLPILSSSQAPNTDTEVILERENNFICSQSFEERPMKTYYFNVNKEYGKVDQAQGLSDIQYPELRSTRIFKTTKQYASSSAGVITIPGQTETEFRVNSNLNLETGDTIAFSYHLSPGDTDYYENMYITSVTHYSASQDGPILQTTASIQRNYLETYDDNTAQRTWDGSNFVSIHKYTPDTIYAIDEAQPYKVRNRKIWVQNSQKVYYVDDRGLLIAMAKEC